MIKLTDQQFNALEMVKRSKISILTGSPGTGKTFLTRQIVEWGRSQGYNMALCSPSGKAAHVLSEATDHPASTIHRLLRPQVTRKCGKLQFYFEHDADNQLLYDFLIVDECSMIGNDLAASLLSAINAERTKVLLIGDSNQLPSITPGNVLADLIACGSVPVTELDEVFRHSGAIINLCQAIRTDDRMYVMPEPPEKKLNPEIGDNFLFINCSDLQAIHDTIITLATINMPKRGYTIDSGDIQVLSPVNKKTVLSCFNLNETLQNIINKQPAENCIENKNGNGHSEEFRLGSKVINTKNQYNIKTVNGDTEVLLNGDIGKVSNLQGKNRFMIVTFENPKREILINKWNHNLKLGWALSIHRSQGSQWPVVIIPIHSVFQHFFSRALLYTACSRSKQILILVGQKSAIRQAIRNTGVYNRCTLLKQKIQNKLLDSL